LTKYKLIEVSYDQLKDLIRKTPTLLEDGLKHINHRIFTSGGVLDVLMVDQVRSLVIVKASDVEEDDILFEGLDDYDIAIRNLDGFVRAYDSLNIDCGQKPRLLLIAPSFSQALQNRIKWIKIPVSLFTYQCIRFDDSVGEIIPIYKEITSPVFYEKVHELGLGEEYSPISDGDRMLAKTIVANIYEWDRERIDLKQTEYDISIQLSGRVLCYIGPRQTHFTLHTNNNEGRWTKYHIRNQQDMEVVLSILRSNYDKMRR
jgi:hypothetical protein